MIKQYESNQQKLVAFKQAAHQALIYYNGILFLWSGT